MACLFGNFSNGKRLFEQCYLHCRRSRLEAILVCALIHDLKTVFKLFLWLGIHIGTQGIRGLPAQAAFMPCPRVPHQYGQRGAVITDVHPAFSKHPPVGYPYLPPSVRISTVCARIPTNTLRLAFLGAVE